MLTTSSFCGFGQRFTSQLARRVSTSFRVKVLKLAHEHAQMAAHRAQHAQREFRLPPKQGQDAVLLDQQNLAWLKRVGIGGIAFVRRQRHFGERLHRLGRCE